MLKTYIKTFLGKCIVMCMHIHDTFLIHCPNASSSCIPKLFCCNSEKYIISCSNLPVGAAVLLQKYLIYRCHEYSSVKLLQNYKQCLLTDCHIFVQLTGCSTCFILDKAFEDFTSVLTSCWKPIHGDTKRPYHKQSQLAQLNKDWYYDGGYWYKTFGENIYW